MPSCQLKQQMEDNPEQILERFLGDICSMKLRETQ